MALSQEPLVFFVIKDQKREIFIFEKVTTTKRTSLQNFSARGETERDRDPSVTTEKRDRHCRDAFFSLLRGF